MAPFRGLPHTTGSAGGSDWVCFVRLPPACRTELGLFGAIAPMCRVDRAPKRISSRLGSRLAPPIPPRVQIGFVSHEQVHYRLLLHTSDFTLQTSGFFHTRPPITRRVARICPEKWIAAPSEIAVSPCSDAHNEYLSAGAFQVSNCCTNRNITEGFD